MTTPTSCAVCGGTLQVRLPSVRDTETGDPYRILACSSCGLGHTDPLPADLGAAYPATYHGGRHGITAAMCARRRVRITRRHIPSGKLLDVGCGDGTFLQEAARRGFHVAGTEMSTRPELRSAGIPVRSTLAGWLPDAPFDGVTLWHVLEHLATPVEEMTRIRELLAPEGRVVVAVPDAEGVQARAFGASWFHLDVPRHVHHFGRRSLECLAERAGLRPLAWHHQELEYDLFGWIQSPLDALLPSKSVLFRLLTGRPSRASLPVRATSLALLPLLGPAAVALTAGSTLAGRGGTLIMIAGRP